MQTDKAIVIKKGALVAGVVVAGGALLLAGIGGSILAAACFTLWVTSPYLVLSLLSWLVERFAKASGRHMVGCVFACLMLAFTLLAFVSTLGDKSSTFGLIFIFVPLWLHLGGVGLYLLSILIVSLADWSRRRTSS